MLRYPFRFLTAFVVASTCLATTALAAPAEAAAPDTPAAPDPSVITEWSVIAARTIFTENATPIPSSGLYFSFVSIATYDAVVWIEGGYEPYRPPPRHGTEAGFGVSSEAAAVTAAYRVLRHYFPASADNLAADYAASLADIPNGIGKLLGRVVGAVAATKTIMLRRHDGRNADITLDVDPAPGVWRPTPPGFLPMLEPWLGFVRPLTLRSPTQMPLDGPDALTSAAYAQDYQEVKDYGALEGSSREPDQTETALFFNYNSVLQYQEGLRDAVTRRGMDIVDSARAFALLNTATADALIACWRAKYDFAYWRPVTAIPLADTDGNPATEPDPSWLPFATTPPYGEYPSGHGCITGAATNTFSYLFGAQTMDVNLFSGVTGTTRHYDSAATLDADAMNARIWLGLHFRRAMTDANQLGHDVSDWTIAHAFKPIG